MDWQRLFYMAASQASRGDVLESRVRGLEPNLAKVALFLSPQVHDVNSQAYTVIDKSMPMNEKYATQTMTKNLFTVSVRRDFLRKVKVSVIPLPYLAVYYHRLSCVLFILYELQAYTVHDKKSSISMVAFRAWTRLPWLGGRRM